MNQSKDPVRRSTDGESSSNVLTQGLFIDTEREKEKLPLRIRPPLLTWILGGPVMGQPNICSLQGVSRCLFEQN